METKTDPKIAGEAEESHEKRKTRNVTKEWVRREIELAAHGASIKDREELNP